MDDKKQNSRDEISDIVTYLEINKELRHEIWCAIIDYLKWIEKNIT